MRASTSELSSVLAAPAPRASNGTAALAVKNRLREVMSNLLVLLEKYTPVRRWAQVIDAGQKPGGSPKGLAPHQMKFNKQITCGVSPSGLRRGFGPAWRRARVRP